MIRREITRGLGAITPEAWSRIVRATEWSEWTRYSAAGAGAEPVADGPERHAYAVDGRIDSATKLAGVARWRYAWTEVRLEEGTDTWAEVDGGQSGDGTAAWALNMLEAGNTSALAYGEAVSDTTVTAHPTYFVGPVPAGAVVRMVARRDDGGVLRWQFAAPNPVTGSCP